MKTFRALFSRLHLISAGLVGALALVVLYGWITHNALLTQIRPNFAPMQFNTAVGFLLAALAMLVLDTRAKVLAAGLGGILAALGAATLLQYLTGGDFGIDQALWKADILTGTSSPGRMAAFTAGCLAALGVCLVFAGISDRLPVARTAIGILACVVGVIACVVICGYLLGIEPAYSLGAPSRMALQTATALLILSGGLLFWSRGGAVPRFRDFPNWMPTTASLTVVVMIGVVLSASFAELKDSIDRQRHSFEVLATARTLVGNIFDSQHGMRGFLLSGREDGLKISREGLEHSRQQFEKLADLVRSDPAQTERLTAIQDDLRRLEDYLQSLLERHEAQGLVGALERESSGDGFAIVSKTRADLDGLLRAENKALAERIVITEDHFGSAGRLLLICSAVAALLILLANRRMALELRRRRQAELDLREASTLQTAILNSAGYAIVSTTPSGIVTTFNSTAERWLGYRSAEIVGKETPLLWHEPEEISARAAALSAELGRPVEPGFEVFIASVTNDAHAESEWSIRRRDGTRFPAAITLSSMTDDAGRVTGYLGVMSDISQRRESEAALSLSEEKFATAFAYSTSGMALVSLEGRWLKVNQALCQALGYTEEELRAKTFQEITHPDDLAADMAQATKLLAGEFPFYKMEKRYFHKDGHVVWALLGGSLLRDAEGRPLYFIAQVEDISGVKNALLRQEELTRKAEAAEKAKSEFLAVMSHEIRTPMNGVLGMTSILADTPLDETQRDCVRTIQTSGDTLLHVINDILDYSKIDAGCLRIEHEAFVLRECLEEVLNLFTAQIRIKKLDVTGSVAPEVPARLVGDALHLRQIFTNLIGNAIKFTDRGRIFVRIERQTSDDGKCHLLCTVADTGIGISPEGIPLLFHAFQQVDTSATRRHGGSGLGLVISQRLAGLMGGEMWVESEQGVGSKFFFTVVLDIAAETPGADLAPDRGATETIPAPGASPEPDPPGTADAAPPLSILLAEDNPTNQKVALLMLSRLGYTADLAADGCEAVEAAGRSRYDVILMDIQMPNMNGLAAMKCIREQHGARSPLIFAVTAEALEGDEARLRAAGFDGYLSKPLTRRGLQALLRSVPRTAP